ncbi:MAG TPA: hypothetical protein VGL81_06150 [Polyangiaceae bacterium]|jgi:energy-converting hydrogenase Eha subunit E
MGPDYYETATYATAWYSKGTAMSDDLLEPTDRGAPLVATWTRWAVSALALAAAFVGSVAAYLRFSHVDRTLASFATLIAVVGITEAVLVLAILRAEESRLTRELRTARTGTGVLRGLVARRRQQTPFLARLFTTKLGLAAVLLADGDRDGALDVLSGGSPLMQGGRLLALRAVVDADLERATGTAAGRQRCIEQLRSAAPLGNREADLYRMHVLVKALLELGDAEAAVEVLGMLEPSRDEEHQLYVAWLRVWFDLDAEAADYRESWPELPEGQLRLATLLARAHGAEKLVEKLEQRVSSIARPHQQE